MAQDRVLATQLGVYAIELAMAGIYGVGVGVRQENLVNAKISDILNEVDDRSPLYELIDKVS